MTTRRGLVIAVLGLTASWLVPAAAPATVAEQRARLPPPAAECDDPVAGTWRAHVYYAHVQTWYELTLDIRRKGGGDELEGPIYSEFWDGGERDEEPPICGVGAYHQALRCTGAGRVEEGDVIRFGGTSCAWAAQHCGTPRGQWVLVTYRGPIDRARNEFQTVISSEAPEWHAVPTVFRRIRCGGADAEALPEVNLAPPWHPPARRSCDCGR